VLITRTRLPAEALPPKNFGDQWVDGLSNGYTTFFSSSEHGTGFYWGARPVLYYPATNSTLGTTKWGSGPSVAFIHEDKGPRVFALVANNIWSFGSGSGSSDRTTQLLLNPIISYHFGDGWAVGSSPDITANWIANGNKWTVPIGGGVSKDFRLSEQPIDPTDCQEPWQLQAKLTFIFPEKQARPVLKKEPSNQLTRFNSPTISCHPFSATLQSGEGGVIMDSKMRRAAFCRGGLISAQCGNDHARP
jgi:hypothetical protein